MAPGREVIRAFVAGVRTPLLADYPKLERADVLAALEFAAAYTRERVIDLPVAG